ncbi:MAG TPA: DinB family protein [Holophaga sp.]|nr:DinB family protein [Holophaga sp.]
MSPEARAELLLAYARGPALLKEALGACPPEALDFRPGSGQWSVRDIAWHLAESELHAYCRARFIVAEPGVTILPFDQDRWADTLEPGNHPLEEALDLFRLLRELLARQLRRLPEAAWGRSIQHPQRGTVTLEQWLGIYEGHLDTHLAQIQRVLTAWRRASAG